MRHLATSLTLLGLAACAGPGGMGPSGGLMYRVPNPTTVAYVTESQSDIDIDAGAMGSFSMKGTSEATVNMAFAAEEGGVRVTARFEKLNASLTQPMGGVQRASEADLPGDIVFTLDRRGRAQVVSVPEVKGAAEQLAHPVGFVHEFFPMLPGEMVEPGATWSDTLEYSVQTSQGDATSSAVLTYTLVGDTVVEGKTLLHVTYEGSAEVTGSGMQEGMEVLQTLSGTVSGSFLWDPARGLLVASEATQDLVGSVEVPAAGMPPMPMSMVGTSTTKLREG